MADAPRHLAQFNIARIRYQLDDPRMAEFVDNVARVNAMAEKIEGFVWRLRDENAACCGSGGIGTGQPMEQRHVVGKQESEMPRLQILVADRGGRGQ